MTQLNNEPVQIGDRLYDIVNGHGTVTALTDRRIEVLFDNGRRIDFNKNGKLGQVRRLYWQNPVILDPPKDAAKWNDMVSTLTSIFDLIKRHR